MSRRRFLRRRSPGCGRRWTEWSGRIWLGGARSGTAIRAWARRRYAPLLRRVYPQARFICLYRHPMDVIASGTEACPWGLNGYGFEPLYRGDAGQRRDGTGELLDGQRADDTGRRGTIPGCMLPGAVRGPGRRPGGDSGEPSSSFSGCRRCQESRRRASRRSESVSDRRITRSGTHRRSAMIRSGAAGRCPTAMIAPQLLGVMNELARPARLPGRRRRLGHHRTTRGPARSYRAPERPSPGWTAAAPESGYRRAVAFGAAGCGAALWADDRFRRAVRGALETIRQRDIRRGGHHQGS